MNKKHELNALLQDKLLQREKAGMLRQLRVAENRVDFCSNDYLGFALSAELKKRIRDAERDILQVGSTGSRLLTGHSLLAEQLEHQIAQFHDSASALLFNSGYDANVGLFASLGRMVDHIVYDELVHASVHDGMRLSKTQCHPFHHNDPAHLEQLLSKLDGPTIVAVESIYSMDGDACRLTEMLDTCKRHGAELIVDEAHAAGLFGSQGQGLVHQMELQNEVFARLVTFGKSLGCHGAAVLGNDTLRQFLINYARPLIYSTAAAPHALLSVKCAYELLTESNQQTQGIHRLRKLFAEKAEAFPHANLISGESAIQGIVVSGAERCRTVAKKVWDDGFDVRPIVAPTVAKGSERIRICLHAFNTEEEVLALTSSLHRALEENPPS